MKMKIDVRVRAKRECDCVAKRRSQHDGFQFMETIPAAGEDFQEDIQLCRAGGLDRQGCVPEEVGVPLDGLGWFRKLPNPRSPEIGDAVPDCACVPDEPPTVLTGSAPGEFGCFGGDRRRPGNTSRTEFDGRVSSTPVAFAWAGFGAVTAGKRVPSDRGSCVPINGPLTGCPP